MPCARDLQPGDVAILPEGRASVLYVAPMATESTVCHVVLGRLGPGVALSKRTYAVRFRPDEPVQVERHEPTPAQLLADPLLELALQVHALVENAKPRVLPGEERASVILLQQPSNSDRK